MEKCHHVRHNRKNPTNVTTAYWFMVEHDHPTQRQRKLLIKCQKTEKLQNILESVNALKLHWPMTSILTSVISRKSLAALVSQLVCLRLNEHYEALLKNIIHTPVCHDLEYLNIRCHTQFFLNNPQFHGISSPKRKERWNTIQLVW